MFYSNIYWNSIAFEYISTKEKGRLCPLVILVMTDIYLLESAN